MPTSSYECLILNVADGIATLTFNRPDKLNAISMKMRQELVQAIDSVSQSDEVRVLVVTGAGRGFCSGADVGSLSNRPEQRSRRAVLAILGEWGFSLAKLEKPTIAAINGVAAGAGLSIALMCDIRIASENARFTGAWIKRGLVPDLGATYLLPKIVGMENAYELMYTGDVIDSVRAKEIALVSRVVPPDDLMKAANDLAAKIANGPPISMQLIKRAVSRGMLDDLGSQFLFETYAQNICFGTDDHKEGVASFLEKRQARFKGI